VLEDGSKYVGDFRCGQKQGQGEYKWADKTHYIGQWNQNTIEGYGCYNWPDGR
jgi:hypothetical protein